MKIALLNDTHFGCRNDSPAFMNYHNRFYDEIFFPYIEKNNIKTLVHLGDVVDRRKFINHNTAHNFKKVFWDKIDELNLDTHIIIGNHDTYYKNTNEVNALQNLNISKNTKIYTRPDNVNFDGLDILFLPWICDDNYNDSIYAIDNSTAVIAMGHLEVKGFEMQKGVYNDHGLEKSQFTKFEKVLSGHFHKKSDDGRIYYLGTQYEITWSDYKCPKGFHIFDTDTREIERIPNPIRMYKKLYYNDKETDYTGYDISSFNNSYVKVFVTNKTDEDMFNKLIERFYNTISVHELQIVEDPIDVASTVRSDILEQGEDTLTFLGNYIDQAETGELDKKKLKEFARDLYGEASE